jgi:CO/xanthine dehydrogenase FAD-binding subunit
MKPAPFSYVRPTTVEEALSALAQQGGEAKVLAGGQSLIAMMNLRLLKPRRLVDINRVAALDYIRHDNGTLAIGALTRLSAAERSPLVAQLCPLMTEAIQHIAHRPIRNRGTVGGNLAHADPSSELPAVAVATDATFVARSAEGQRTILAADFFVGYLTSALQPDELLTEVRVPSSRLAGQGWSFMEVSPRKGDFALVGVAATLQVKDGTCQAARLVYSGVAGRAQRVPEAEQALVGRTADEAAFRAAAGIASQRVHPHSDFHATAAYRRDLVNVLTRRALAQALARCGERSA